MKEEDLLDDIAAACSTLLPDAGEEVISTVPDEIKSVCMIYDVEFWDFLEAQ